jgi:signal transduction histidine kinase
MREFSGVQYDLFGDERMASVTAAAHELKAPLSTIQYMAALLKDTETVLTERQQQDYLSHMQLTAQRSLQLIDSLTQSFNVSQLDLELEPVNVAHICEDVLSDVAPLARSLSQTVDLTLPKRSPLALAHHSVLRSVITNLCDNALKHNPPESHVAIAISQPQQHIRVAVRDSGSTVRAGDFKRLKQKIGKELHPLSGRVGSSGLGLYIASQLADAMGGHLDVRRHRTNGMTFSVQLQPSYQLTLV